MAEDYMIQCPVNGAGPVDVLMQDPPAGAYLGEITACDKHTKTEGGKTSIQFTVAVAEPGPAQGIMTRVWIGTNWAESFNVGHFVNMFAGVMENLGKTPDEIKAKLAAMVSVPTSALVGKKCFLLVKPAPEELDAQGRRPFADKNFVTRAQYESAKKLAATMGLQAPAKKAAAAAPPADAFGSPATAPPAASTGNGANATPPPPPAAAAGAPVGDLFG